MFPLYIRISSQNSQAVTNPLILQIGKLGSKTNDWFKTHSESMTWPSVDARSVRSLGLLWNELLSQAAGVSAGGLQQTGTTAIWNGLVSLLPGGWRMD